MELVPKQSIYSLQLTGDGGMAPLPAGSPLSEANPVWLHLDYGKPDAQQWLLNTPLLNEAAREALLGQSNRPKLLHGKKKVDVTKDFRHTVRS